MADCEYQIEGSDKIYSESEFKKLLSEGYLDKVMMDKGIKIRGIKADEALASSFQLPSVVQPQVQPTAEVTETVTPTAEVTETVTPEVKTEEVVTPTETVTEEKSFDDRVAEEYAKLTDQVSYKENPKKETEYAKNKIKNSYRYKNGEISAKEYLESTGHSDNTIIGDKRFSELSDDEIKYEADTNIEFFDKLINGARQKVQDETVTKTEEVVTEPTAETKTEQVNERKKILSEELDNADINSLRTSLRKKDPNGYTLQILDELQEAKKNENLVLDENVAYMLDNGITLSNVKNMLIEDGLFETSQEVDNYFMQIGGQKSSGLFKRLSGLKTEKKTKAPATTETKEQEQKINVNPLQGYSFTYESEQDIPNELKGVSPIVRSESTVGKGKKAKTNIRLTFSGQQLIDAGLGQQEEQPTAETKQPTKEIQEKKNEIYKLEKQKDDLLKSQPTQSNIKNTYQDLLNEKWSDTSGYLSPALNNAEDKFIEGKHMYEIRPLGNNKFEYKIVSNKASQFRAFSILDKVIEPVAQGLNRPDNADIIVTTQTGIFRKDGDKYIVEKKAKVFYANSNTIGNKVEGTTATPTAKVDTTEIDAKITKSKQELSDLESANAKTKQPTKEAVAAKNMADILRKAKIKMEGGTAMSSVIPGFDTVWSATIETVAKAIELGGVTAGNFRQSIEAGMKALKNSDAYKAITDPKQRAKISARYKKILTSAYSEGYGIDTDDLRNAEFETFNQKLEENKGKTLSAKEFNAIKSEAKKFVNDNLPADKYRKSEVQSYVRNNFDKAKTVEDIQKNLDKVNNIIIAKEEKIQKETEKEAAKDRKELIKEIQSKIKPRSKSVVGADKKGKISLDSQRVLNSYVDDLKRRGVYNSLDTLTDAELSDMNEDLNTIIDTGKSERKALKSIEDRKKKESQALILQALAKGNPIILNGKEGIMDKLEKTSGVVIIDNQAMNLKDFKDYSTLNPDAELRDIPFYRKETTERIKEKTKPGIFKSLKTKYTLFGLADVETGLIKLGTGSSKLKTWLENEIWAPIRAAERKKIINEAQLVAEYKDKANEVFGTIEIPVPFKEKGIMVKSMLYSALAKPSGIKRIDPSQVTGETDELTAGKVVHLYGILNNPDISKEEKQADIDRLRRYNNVDAKDIIKFMEDPKNKEYLDYYNVIKDFYNGKLGDEFKPSIEDLYNIALQDKYYYPRPAAGTVVEGENLITPESGVGALSAIAPNMRPREEKTPTTAFAEVDAHEMMMNYIDSMTRAKEYIPIAKAANVLLSDINRPYVISKFNDLNAYNTFIKDLNLSILGTTPTQDFPQLNKLNNMANLGYLWFRIKSVPTQAIAFVNYYSAGIKDGITPMHILAATAPVNKAELEFWDKFYTDNPYLLYRLSGGNITPETQAIQREIESAAKKYAKGLMSLVTFTGLLEIKGGDLLAIASPLGGASFAAAEFRKNYNQSKDFDDAREKAMQRWYEETERTQQLSAAKEIVSNASYSLGYRFMFPFSSAQAGYMKKAYKGYLNLKDWDSLNNKEKLQSFSDMIYYPLFANVSFLLASGGALAYWQLSDDKEDDEKKKSLKEKQKQRVRYDLLMDDLQSSIQMMGIPGRILNGFLNTQRGRALFNEVPLFQTFSKAYDAFTPLMKIDPNLKFSEMTKEQQEKIKERYPSSIFSNPIRNQSEKEAVDKAFQELSAFEKISIKEKEKMFKAFMLTNPINFANNFAEYAKGEMSTSEFVQGKKRDPKKADGSLVIDYFDDKPSEETLYKYYDEITNKIAGKDVEAESYFTEEMRPKKEKVKGKREGGRSKRRGRRGR